LCEPIFYCGKLKTIYRPFNEDFTSIILRSVPASDDTYIAAITATSSLLNQTLTPTNLINTICDVDQRVIKHPKSKRDEHDTAFVAGQSKGGGNSSKKIKKDVECYNCHKMGHMKKDCWALGGGVDGKGSKKGKGKQKVTAANAETKDSGKDDEVDGVWMVNAEMNSCVLVVG
jgi:hypothetical protein